MDRAPRLQGCVYVRGFAPSGFMAASRIGWDSARHVLSKAAVTHGYAQIGAGWLVLKPQKLPNAFSSLVCIYVAAL